MIVSIARAFRWLYRQLVDDLWPMQDRVCGPECSCNCHYGWTTRPACDECRPDPKGMS